MPSSTPVCAAPPSPRRAPRRLLALRLVSLALGLLLPLLAVEAGLRLFHPVAMHASDTFLIPDTQEAQAGMMSLRPGAVTRSVHNEFDVEVRISRQGLRDREYARPRPPGVYRILVLGDSQTFGWGVEEPESYPRRLETLLRRATGQRVEVVNAGIPGTGTAQQLYFLQEQGWSFEPDLLVVGCFFTNDIGDNGLNRLFAAVNGRLVTVMRAGERSRPLHEVALWQPEHSDFRVVRPAEAPLVPRPGFWVRHSHLVRLVREQVARIRKSREPQIPWGRMRHARELTVLLMDEIRRRSAVRGVPCLFLLIPGAREVAPGPERDAVRSGMLRLDLPPRPDVLDLLPPLRAEPQRTFFRGDPHLSAAGHRVVAETVAPRLLTMMRSRASSGGRKPE